MCGMHMGAGINPGHHSHPIVPNHARPRPFTNRIASHRQVVIVPIVKKEADRVPVSQAAEKLAEAAKAAGIRVKVGGPLTACSSGASAGAQKHKSIAQSGSRWSDASGMGRTPGLCVGGFGWGWVGAYDRGGSCSGIRVKVHRLGLRVGGGKEGWRVRARRRSSVAAVVQRAAPGGQNSYGSQAFLPITRHPLPG